MKVENMVFNARTAFKERKEIIDKLNECINFINTKINNIETKNAKQDDDINNLKNADTNNVKINKINEYAVGLTGNQNISGVKNFTSGISAYPNDWHNVYMSGNIGDINLFAKLKNQGSGKYLIFELIQSSNTAICYGILGVHNINHPTSNIAWFLRKGFGDNNPLQLDSIVIANDGTNIYLGSRKKSRYGHPMIRVKVGNSYEIIDTNPTGQIEWLSAPINIGDGNGYALTEAVE